MNSDRVLVVINFGDNDFRETWEGVLRLMFQSWKRRGEMFPRSFTDLLRLANDLAPVAYRLFQQHEGPAARVDEGVVSYLRLSPDDLFVGAGAQEWLDARDPGYDNHATHVLDTALDYPGNDVVWTR